jgi:hypothetical protein
VVVANGKRALPNLKVPFGMAARLLTAAAATLFTLTGMLIAQDEPPAQPKAKSATAPAGQDEKPGTPADEQRESLEKFLQRGSKQWHEAVQGARVGRELHPSLRAQRKVFHERPSSEEQKRVDELKKKGDYKNEDVPLIERVAKYDVYMLADPDKWKKAKADLEAAIDRPPDKFTVKYREFLRNYLPDLLDNHLYVRVNAMRLLAKLKDQQAIGVFVENLGDPQQHEAVKYCAVQGVILLAQQRITDVGKESEAVAALLGMLSQNEPIHRLTRQMVVRALGTIGRTNSVAIRRDADVGVALLRIIRDPNIRRLDRAEAVTALANLQVPAELDYNFQYAAYEIGLFAADSAASAIADPTADDLISHLFLLSASDALVGEVKEKTSLNKQVGQHPSAKGKGDPEYVRQIGEHVKRISKLTVNIYKPLDRPPGQPAAKEDLLKRRDRVKNDIGALSPALEQLQTFLKTRPPRSTKLAPDAPDLGPPPALAGMEEEAPAQPKSNGEPTDGQVKSSRSAGP